MLLVQIAMLIYGIVILVKGKFSVGKGKILLGKRARLCGTILVSPIFLSHLVLFIWALTQGMSGAEVAKNDAMMMGAVIGIIVLFAALFSAVILGNILYKMQAKESTKQE